LLCCLLRFPHKNHVRFDLTPVVWRRAHVLSTLFMFAYLMWWFLAGPLHIWHRCSTLLTKFGTALTTILPILFQYCYKSYHSDSRNLWAVMKEGGFGGALKYDSTHHFFRNACTKSGSLRFSQFSGCCYKADTIIIGLKCHLFSQWYRLMISYLTLNSNRSLDRLIQVDGSLF
jgi:hypothetical protein